LLVFFDDCKPIQQVVVLAGAMTDNRPAIVKQSARQVQQSVIVARRSAFATIGLREGQIEAASDLIDIARGNFANPEFGLFLLESSYGATATNNPLTRSLDAFGYLLLAQWSNLLEATQAAIVIDPSFYDLYLLEGLAYCNLGEYEAAEASYTTLIEVEPDYAIGYALRADVRLQQGDTLGALADGGLLLISEQAEAFLPFTDAIQAGAINCTNLLTVDLDAMRADSAGE